jgi:transposase
MKDEGLKDGRKIPDEVMEHLRRRAVHAIRGKGHSPEVVAEIFGFSRSSVYEWLGRYDRGGDEALDSRPAPGAEAVITEEIDAWLKETVLNSTPMNHGYDTLLWNRDLLAELLHRQFGITVRGVTVSQPLRKLGLSYQKPQYQQIGRDEEEIASFLQVKFPKIQRLAEKRGAEIGFEDEAGVAPRTCSGRTWGLIGQPPVLPVSPQRNGYNLLSVATAQGKLRYDLTDKTLNSDIYINFLRQLIQHRRKPLILLVDRAPFHQSQPVRDFVRAHRTQLRVFFLPKKAPELNPDEQVWNELKNDRLGKQPVKNKTDLRARLESALKSLQQQADRVRSFFQLPETQYAAE